METTKKRPDDVTLATAYYYKPEIFSLRATSLGRTTMDPGKKSKRTKTEEEERGDDETGFPNSIPVKKVKNLIRISSRRANLTFTVIIIRSFVSLS